MDPFELEFVEYSLICDDPKLLEKIKNRYYDPEFDEWLEEFDEEQRTLELQKRLKDRQNLDMPDPETIKFNSKAKSILPTEDYEMGDRSQISSDDWEVDD